MLFATELFAIVFCGLCIFCYDSDAELTPVKLTTQLTVEAEASNLEMTETEDLETYWQIADEVSQPDDVEETSKTATDDASNSSIGVANYLLDEELYLALGMAETVSLEAEQPYYAVSTELPKELTEDVWSIQAEPVERTTSLEVFDIAELFNMAQEQGLKPTKRWKRETLIKKLNAVLSA